MSDAAPTNEHSPTPWKFVLKDDDIPGHREPPYGTILDANGKWLNDYVPSSPPRAPNNAIENARHIVECVNNIERLRNERDQWKRGVGEICSAIPLPDVIKSTGTFGDLIAYIKEKFKDS